MLLVNWASSPLKGQSDDIQESAVLEGYRCKDEGCNGFLLRSSGLWLAVISHLLQIHGQLVGQSYYFCLLLFGMQMTKGLYANNVDVLGTRKR